MGEQYVAVPESYLSPEWRAWAVHPPSTTLHGVDNTAQELNALENTTPSLRQDGMTRTEKNRHFHRIIEKFLEQREEDHERPVPVALKVKEKKGSKKYVNITKEDTDQLLQAFLNIKAQQQQQQQPPLPPPPLQTPQNQPLTYPQTPTTSKIKKKKPRLLTPLQKSTLTPEEIETRYQKRRKKLAELKAQKQQTGKGYGSRDNNNNSAIRPVHFTSLFSGRHTVLI